MRGGHDSGWNTQGRDEGGIPFMEVVRQYARFTLFGLVLGIGAWVVSPSLFFWMTPVLLGLVFSIPLVAFTSSRDVGLRFRRAGLLLVPEETNAPDVLKKLERAEAQDQSPSLPDDALRALRADPALCQAHIAMLPAERRVGEPIDAHQLVGLVKLEEAPSLGAAESRLTLKEKAAVLGSRKGVDLILHLPEA